ncbi:hypothetical protein Tco_0800597 [Tanacetum coccineum]|uniref:Transposase (Putative), gypsy type n=1 Tax=Tanacetum coccineum TaxID=301880 RepID=A0ABQ4ZTK1_9ASTR
MGRDTIQLEIAVSTISPEYLLEFTSEYDILEDLHPELPGPEERIVDFPEGKVGVYTKFFEFANFRLPISQFLFYILGHYQIHLSQLSVIGAAKDEMPVRGSYSAEDVAVLNTRRTPIQKQPEALLCIVGLSRRYFLGDDVYPTFLNDDDRDMDLFNLISALNRTKVKTGSRPRAAHEVPLLTVTANRVIDMEDPVATMTSSETPSVMEKSPLDFSSEDPPPMIINKGETEDQAPAVVSQEVPSAENIATTEVVPEVNLEKEIATMRPPINKKRRKRDRSAVEANAPPKVLRKDPASIHATHDTRGGNRLVKVSSKGTATEIPTEGVATTEVNVQFSMRSPESGRSTSAPSIVGSLSGIYQPGWGVTNDYRLDTPEACQDMVDHTVPPGYFSKLRHLPNTEFLAQYNINLARQVALGSQLRLRFEQEVRLLKKARAQNLETLLEAEVDMKKATEAKNAELAKELESLCAKFSDLQLNNNQLSQQVSTLQAQVTGEERIKAAFEEFKKYEDNKVEQRCAEMDARLDKLSVDIDEELYPHMLTAIAGRRWVIGHGLRLAVMKCAESSEIRQAFANVVSAGLAKGMSEGLKYGIEHGKAGRDLADVEAYDPEANNKLVKALQDLKDLKYPMVDQLEKLKDAPMELIMASLHLESDTGEDAPQWIRDLRPSSSQLKIPIYPEVRAPEDPWAVKEEVPLEDAIAANISRAEKKKKCRVVCRTHGIGSAHHARSDGIPVSVPTVVPQGLAILLTDAGTQTQRSEDEASPRLLRSKSLPPMYNLDWP